MLYDSDNNERDDAGERLQEARETFLADDRYCKLTDSDRNCHGEDAVAWLLDPANSTSFMAVLDTEDDTVATLDENGEVVWESLESFYGL